MCLTQAEAKFLSPCNSKFHSHRISEKVPRQFPLLTKFSLQYSSAYYTKLLCSCTLTLQLHRLTIFWLWVRVTFFQVQRNKNSGYWLLGDNIDWFGGIFFLICAPVSLGIKRCTYMVRHPWLEGFCLFIYRKS